MHVGQDNLLGNPGNGISHDPGINSINGGSLFTEIRNHSIDFREDCSVFIFPLGEIFVAVALIISWKRSKLGAWLTLALIVLILIFGVKESINIIILHTPWVIPGLILLFYAYYEYYLVKKQEHS